MNEKKIRIRASSISEIFWNHIYHYSGHLLSNINDHIKELYLGNKSNIELAEYNTGSISMLDAFHLACLFRFYSFDRVVEVGTFIGNSALAMAYGNSLTQTSSVIHTCDYSNDIRLSNPYKDTDIVQYPKTTSTQMLTQLVEESFQADFVYLDGRVAPEDLVLLDRITTDKTVIGFDDFEGIEKGVVNLSAVMRIKKFGAHIHVPPPEYEVFRKLPLWNSPHARSVTMLLVPPSFFSFSRS